MDKIRFWLRRVYDIRIHPAAGLVCLFFLYVLAGVLLSFLYRFAMERMDNPAGMIVAPFVFAAVLGGCVFGLKRLLTVRFNIAAFIMVLIGCAAVYFLVWNQFPLRGAAEPFAFWERDLPEAARDIIAERELPELTMLILAWLEAGIVAAVPLYMAFRRAGIFLPKYNRWAKLRVMDYGFIPFNDRELERIAGGEGEVILRKRIDLTGQERVHAIALCYVDDALTEYLAVYKAEWNRQGYIERGRLLLVTAMPPVEKVKDLQEILYKIHRESEFEEQP